MEQSLTDYFPEISQTIMLLLDIEDIETLSTINNKYIHKILNDKDFWYQKFNHNHLKISPYVSSIKGWILSFKHESKIMVYVNHVMETLNHDKVRIDFHDLSPFHKLDTKVVEDLYLSWYKLSNDYFDDVRGGYDDNIPVGTLYINKNEKYRLQFSIIYKKDAILPHIYVDEFMVREILYQLIFNYNYPWVKDEVVRFDIK